MNDSKFEINQNVGDYSASFYIMLGHKIAIADLTFLGVESGFGYLDLVKNNKLGIEEEDLTSLILGSDKIMFFSRLNVPENFRGLGYGSKLLKSVIDFCDENNYFLINTANSYGDLEQNELIRFYERGGMFCVHDDGLLLYHKDLKKLMPKNTLGM
jgi:GNAT superfamily N-acetyltransferase